MVQVTTRAGALRHKVKIQTRGSTQDSYGELDPSWSDLATRRAWIDPLRGREQFAAQQVQADVTHRIRMRWDTTIDAMTSKHRIVNANSTGQVFDIESVVNVDERNTLIEVMAVEKGT